MHPHEQLTPLDGDVVVFEYVDDDGRVSPVRVRDVIADAERRDAEKAADVRHWAEVGDLGALRCAAEWLDTLGEIVPDGFGGAQGEVQAVGVASNRGMKRTRWHVARRLVSRVRTHGRPREHRARSVRRSAARNKSPGRLADDDPHEPEHVADLREVA